MLFGFFGLFGGKLSRDAVRKLIMRGRGLVDKDLAGLDLSGLHMPGTLFNNANMVGTNLSESTLLSCQLNGTDLSKAVLVSCEIHDGTLEGTLLAGADLDKAEFEGCTWVGVDLSWASLKGTKLSGCTFRQCNFEGAVLTGAELSRSKFTDCRFEGVDLLAATTEDCEFEGCAEIEAMPPKYNHWIDIDHRERFPYCQERLETLKEVIPGKIINREDDDEVHYSGRRDDRPFRVKVSTIMGGVSVESKVQYGQEPFRLCYDPKEHKKVEEVDDDWDDTDEREQTHFLAEGLYLRDYPVYLAPKKAVLEKLPSTFGAGVVEAMVRVNAFTFGVDRDTASMTFNEDVLTMDLEATMPVAIAFMNKTAALLESLGRAPSEGERMSADIMAQAQGQMRAALTPDMLTPIEGFDLAAYAAIEAERVHLATEDYPEGFQALLARFGLDEARFTLVSSGWQARMMDQTNLMAAGAIATEYSQHFAAAAVGPYGACARATAPHLGTDDAPDGPEPMPFERYVEIATAQQVWLSQGQDAGALAHSTFELSTGDWANIEIYWGQQMRANLELFDTMGTLQERYVEEYG